MTSDGGIWAATGYLPEDQGFDINKRGCQFGFPPGGYFSPYKNPKLSDGPKGEHLDDRLADHTAVIFMSDNGGLSTSEGSPTSNLPMRAGKGWLYEGGIREPMIVKWPGVTRPGSTCNTPVISTDFHPTILQMAGLPLKLKTWRASVGAKLPTPNPNRAANGPGPMSRIAMIESE